MRVNKPLLILPVETKVRELHGKLFFSYMAALEGYEVIVGDQVEIWEYADLFPRGIYISKGVAATHAEWFKKLKRYGYQVVSWDEEGLIFFSPEVYNKLKLNQETLDRVDLFFCWGDVQKQAVLTTYPQYEDKVVVSGNPRFDLLRKDNKTFYRESAQRIKEKYGKILLINTNFAYCNHYKSRDEVLRMFRSYPLASEEGFMEGWIEHHQQGFDFFFELIPYLVKRYPEYTVVVRPHPSERLEPWQKLAGYYDNMVVNGEGNVHEWLMASDVMLHDDCTTAVEAFILGVPPIAYRKPGGKEKYMNFLPNALSCQASSPEMLFELIDLVIARDEAVRQRIWSSEKWSVLKRYAAGLEGKSSSEVILQHLRQQVQFREEEVSFSCLLERFLKRRWRILLRNYRQLRNPSDGYTKKKFPGLERTEIAACMELFSQIQGKTNGVKVKRVVKNVFSVQVQ